MIHNKLKQHAIAYESFYTMVGLVGPTSGFKWLNHCQRIGMILECCEYRLTRAAFMYHDDQGHDALMHHAALKGFVTGRPPFDPV